jgi:uncharacterized protein YndB with AHSA1/START domain
MEMVGHPLRHRPLQQSDRLMRALLLAVVLVALIAAVLLVPLPWPEALVGGHFVDAADIAAPPERVFAYVATPANWPRWHPASRAVRGIVDRTPAVGESVVETFEIAGRRGDATWTTRELDPPRRWAFDATSPGGGGASIVYTLTPAPGGTRFQRDIHYRGPNLLFGIANAVTIRAAMESQSAIAVANVKRDVEAGK